MKGPVDMIGLNIYFPVEAVKIVLTRRTVAG
jgi:hypothetical protein